jgi:uncharacterized protein
MRRRIGVLGIGLAILCLASCVNMGSVSPLSSLERSMVYHPKPFSDELRGAEAAFEDAHFVSSDGTKLHGWFIPHANPRAVALFMHGNGGNITNVASTLVLLNERHGLAVMSFDYRGYGQSEGKPEEKGILADARAARAWLAMRTGVAEQNILLMGHSMGGGVAVDLAASDGARGLVLSNTFTSLPAVGNHHLPLLPTRLLMTQRLDSLSKISRYQGPLLQSHGDADQVVPYKLGRQLFDAANEPKTFITLAGGGHNDPKDENYRIELDAFIDALPPLL